MRIRSLCGLCIGREGNLLETDGSIAQGNRRRRNGDCRIPKWGLSREAIDILTRYTLTGVWERKRGRARARARAR